MRCYFKDQAWVRVQECVEAFRERDDRKAKDPFHEDPFLVFDDVARLKTDAFVKTGHDRGHMAPNNAFSWNLCATYHTFTMANMSPQRASLNRNKWNRLEQQVLYWGVEHGPAHVVTGTVFNKFPARRFRIYNEAIMDGNEIYSKRSH
jgi:DNA/RNA endonuclease G (NUC1)